jgi:mRNA-degrading endonuclease RelE of RelBE toxin-antitoxin system
MADYGITFARSARKELEALDAAIVNRIFPKIESLSCNPRPTTAIIITIVNMTLPSVFTLVQLSLLP